jgi:diaminopropionate ammonia-lyase
LQGGVGGLAASVIAHLWEELGPEQCPLFAIVEPDRADCLFQSAVHGKPTSASGDLRTVMVGLSCGEVSRPAWPIVHSGAEFFMKIDDGAALEAMHLLHRGELAGESIGAGASGAAGLAGLFAATSDPAGELARQLRLKESSVVLTIGTEGVTDPEIFERLAAS